MAFELNTLVAPTWQMELNGNSGSNLNLETGGKGGPPQIETNSGLMGRISTTRSNPTLVIDSPGQAQLYSYLKL